MMDKYPSNGLVDNYPSYSYALINNCPINCFIDSYMHDIFSKDQQIFEKFDS